ncbi:hypothetical protein BJX63DRAFT_411226 [Aspergillus granulosus]|uniref:Uncharacterized protein n=1 Tax=Aspergillus granulosus TaxID=176169 RepID=A0ABR4GYT2_9EURO
MRSAIAMLWVLFMVAVADAVLHNGPQPTRWTDLKTVAAILDPTSAPPLRSNRVDLHRRDTTSQAESSICGYYEGSKNSRLACYHGNACVFHAPDSEFPGMVGCCLTTSTTTPCIIFSTCYNSAEISATPSLLSSTSDPFVMLCTYEDNPECHTRTWPDLNVSDFACTDETSSQPETMYTAGSLTDVDDDEDQITETISVSWIADAVLHSLRSVSATTTSTSETTTPQSTPSESPSTGLTSDTEDSDPKSDDSSTPVGAIVGGIVGGVVGITLLAVGGWLIWRRRRKSTDPGQQEEAKPQPRAREEVSELHGGTASGRHELMAQREIAELPTQEVRYELE